MKGLQICYGKNDDRNIWPGELSICMRHLYDILECCRNDPEMLSASPYAISLRIVKAAHLEYLLDYPTAMKQIERTWKDMVDRFSANEPIEDL